MGWQREKNNDNNGDLTKWKFWYTKEWSSVFPKSRQVEICYFASRGGL